MTKRNLDGIYVRIQIDNKWQNRCLTDMTWEQVEEWIQERFSALDDNARIEMLRRIACHLHKRLRSVGDALDITGREKEEDNE